jgi:hypothetical protein
VPAAAAALPALLFLVPWALPPPDHLLVRIFPLFSSPPPFFARRRQFTACLCRYIRLARAPLFRSGAQKQWMSTDVVRAIAPQSVSAALSPHPPEKNRAEKPGGWSARLNKAAQLYKRDWGGDGPRTKGHGIGGGVIAIDQQPRAPSLSSSWRAARWRRQGSGRSGGARSIMPPSVTRGCRRDDALPRLPPRGESDPAGRHLRDRTMRERSLIGGDGDQSRDGSIYADYWQIDLIRICIKCIRCGDVAAQDESPSRCSAQIVTVMCYAGFTTLRRHVKNGNISDTKLLHLPFGPRLSVGFKNYFWASSTVNDMFTHFEQLRYLDFYALIKLSVVLPHGVCKIPRKF